MTIQRNSLATRPQRGRNLPLLLGGALLLAPLLTLFAPQRCLALNYLLNPADSGAWMPGEPSFEFEVNSGQIRNHPGSFSQGNPIKSDLQGNFKCTDIRKTLEEINIKGPNNWSVTRTSFSGKALKNAQGAVNSVHGEPFAAVPLATTAQLRDRCRASGPEATMSLDFDLGAKCVDNQGQGSWQRNVAKLVLHVTCADEKPTTVKQLMELSCPPGYWISGTGWQSHEFEWTPAFRASLDSKTCVPQGTGKACPFIYTQDEPGGEWLPQGTILTYHNGKATERTQSQELKNFSGSVLIREIDPETSYIDSLSVVLFYPDGSKVELAPVLEELQAIDGDYLTTDQGDEVEVVFEAPADWAFERAEIIAHGYYEPY